MTLHRHPATRRAYTLMELGVVLVLTVLLVFGMVRWLVGVGYSARSGIEGATDRRAATVLDKIGEDMLALRHCDPNGADARIVHVAANGLPAKITITTDPDGDGTPETVTWRHHNGDIQRGEAPTGAGCETGEITEWTTWIRDVDTFELTLIRDGQEDPTGTTGNCDNEYLPRCSHAPLIASISIDETTETRVYGS